MSFFVCFCFELFLPLTHKYREQLTQEEWSKGVLPGVFTRAGQLRITLTPDKQVQV